MAEEPRRISGGTCRARNHARVQGWSPRWPRPCCCPYPNQRKAGCRRANIGKVVQRIVEYWPELDQAQRDRLRQLLWQPERSGPMNPGRDPRPGRGFARLGEQGHHGVRTAWDTLQSMFLAEVTSDGSRDPNEPLA
jgi:hypothetical protein